MERDLKRARLIILRWCYAIASIIIIIWSISPWYSIKFNGVKSIQGTIFLLDKTVMPRHGEVAYFKPPEGNLYPDKMHFGKYIAGSPGDIVTIKERQFYINDQYIGYAHPHTTNGIPLKMSHGGVIPENYYFMWGEHEQSYDSRYQDIGWIHKNNIVGRLLRIL